MNGRSRTAVLVTTLATAGAVLATVVPARAELPAPTSTRTVTVTRSPSPAPTLHNIRTGRHPSYDRVVFDLSGQAPGYTVGYVSQPVYDGSGAAVRLRGSYYLQVRLRPAAAHDSAGHVTYTCPRRFDVDDPTLRAVVINGDFEGVVSVVLGLSHKAGFRVFTLSSPTRVVVDVAH